MDCDQAYIGETARTAEENFAEHKRAIYIRNANEENCLFDHIARNEGHRIDWSEASIVTSAENRHHPRKTLEALYINANLVTDPLR